MVGVPIIIFNNNLLWDPDFFLFLFIILIIWFLFNIIIYFIQFIILFILFIILYNLLYYYNNFN